jgi:hypothetical protein
MGASPMKFLAKIAYQGGRACFTIGRFPKMSILDLIFTAWAPWNWTPKKSGQKKAKRGKKGVKTVPPLFSSKRGQKRVFFDVFWQKFQLFIKLFVKIYAFHRFYRIFLYFLIFLQIFPSFLSFFRFFAIFSDFYQFYWNLQKFSNILLFYEIRASRVRK